MNDKLGQYVKSWVDEKYPMQEFYQSNFGRGIAEQKRDGIKIGLLAGFRLGVEFAEWAYANEWEQKEKGIWYKWNGDGINGRFIKKNTPELTELFIESKMKEK